MRLASRSVRLAGQIIDGIVAIVPMGVLVAFDDPESPASMLYLPALLFIIGYLLFADALPRGQSLGKRLLGIAVVGEASHVPCSVFQSFVRNLVAPIAGVLDWIFIFGSRRQRLGDMAAGTIVVVRDSVYVELDQPVAIEAPRGVVSGFLYHHRE
jgi:uncharacterized RDD family membrane protein YckC